MSDIPQAPDWWQASDGKWYPPQPGQDPFSQVSGIPDPNQPVQPFGTTPPGVTFGAPPPPSGRGCATVGVIISIITVLVVGGIIAISVYAVDEASDAIDDNTFFDDDDELLDDIEVTDCRQGESFDWAEATLEVTNTTDDPSTFFIEITFESRNGSRQFGSGNAIASSVQPGRTIETEASSTVEVPNRFTCTVTSVDRVAN